MRGRNCRFLPSAEWLLASTSRRLGGFALLAQERRARRRDVLSLARGVLGCARTMLSKRFGRDGFDHIAAVPGLTRLLDLSREAVGIRAAHARADAAPPVFVVTEQGLSPLPRLDPRSYRLANAGVDAARKLDRVNAVIGACDDAGAGKLAAQQGNDRVSRRGIVDADRDQPCLADARRPQHVAPRAVAEMDAGPNRPASRIWSASWSMSVTSTPPARRTWVTICPKRPKPMTIAAPPASE